MCGGRRRALRVVCVVGREPPACPALRSLRDACRELRARLHPLPFDTLALGDTGTLERFYNAGEDAAPLVFFIPVPLVLRHREHPAHLGKFWG